MRAFQNEKHLKSKDKGAFTNDVIILGGGVLEKMTGEGVLGKKWRHFFYMIYG